MPVPWTQEDIARLKRMRDEHKMEWDEIAAAFGRSYKSVKERYHYENLPPEKRKARRRGEKEAWRCRTGLHVTRSRTEGEDQADILARISIARDLRHRDLSSELLGDPPIGRSALDIKRGTYVP